LDIIHSDFTTYELIFNNNENPFRAKARELVALFGDDVADNEHTIDSLRTKISFLKATETG
jgi:hypothetical protein